jgi:hypothetical protein
LGAGSAAGTVAQWLGRATALGVGDFYTGKLDRLTGRVSWKPSATFSSTLSGTRNSGRLPQSDFLRELVGARVGVNASLDLQLNAFVQYDNESGTVDAHTRLRWTFDRGATSFSCITTTCVMSGIGGSRSPINS